MTQNTQATLRYKNVEIVEEVEKMERLKKQTTQELQWKLQTESYKDTKVI